MNVQAAINAGIAVQFVYDNWQSVSQTTDLKGQTIVIGDKSYQVVNTIYANDLATEISPDIQGFKTIGVVAANKVDPTDVYIAIRGTSNIWEWIQDFKFLPRPFPPVQGSGLTEDGFTDMYLTFSLTASQSTGNFIQDLFSLFPSNAKVTVTGHSLGAALATLLAFDMSANTPKNNSAAVALYTLASPRVGDLSFMHLFNHVVANAYRIHNRLDIVTKTPPPLLYYHVGDETELVPSPDMKFDIVCEHHLPNYLNMLAALISLPGFPISDECLKTPPVVVAHSEV